MILGIVGIVIAIAIWLIKEYRTKKALRRQQVVLLQQLPKKFAGVIREQLPEMLAVALAKEHEERTGQHATPEMRAEFKAVAGAAATILGSYVNPDFFLRLALGQDPWLSLTPKSREALEKEAGKGPKPDKQEKPGGPREEDEK